MNVNKILILLVLLSLQGFAQKKDAYFLLDKNDIEYVFNTDIGKLNIETSLSKFTLISLLYREEYEKLQKKINKNKKNETYSNDPDINQNYNIPSLDFEVISKKAIELNDCELKTLHLVDFNWLKRNSWTENNPNILFKDLYFLFKIEKDKYISYKVGRTLIEY